MQHDAIGKLLGSAQRHLWLQGLIDRGWVGLILMSGILVLAAIVHTIFIPLTVSLWGPAALFPLAAATLVAAFNRPSLEEASRSVDRWLDSQDLLTAACYLRSQNPGPASSAALVVLDQANRVATNVPRSLPHVREARNPLITTMAIAVAATSLFFLSLQGAAQSGRVAAPVFNDSFTRDQKEEVQWLPILEPDMTAASADIEGMQNGKDLISSNLVPSKNASLQVSRGTKESGQDELDSDTRANALRAPSGAGAGRVASNESPPDAVDRMVADEDSALADLELVTLKRTPTGEAVTIDLTLSNELIPFESDQEQYATMAQNVSAAKAAKEPFSRAVGPAYRTLQIRYFEETSPND